MTRDFFDQLTDPHAEAPESTDAESAQLQNELGPAIRLLKQAGPENGIDLVPVWERLITDELQSQTKLAQQPPVRTKTRRFAPVFRYAAVLLVGLGVGMLAQGPNAPSPAIVNSDRQHHYSPEQRQTMFAILQTDDWSNEQTSQLKLAAADLSGCVGCHDSALGQKLVQLLKR